MRTLHHSTLVSVGGRTYIGKLDAQFAGEHSSTGRKIFSRLVKFIFVFFFLSEKRHTRCHVDTRVKRRRLVGLLRVPADDEIYTRVRALARVCCDFANFFGHRGFATFFFVTFKQFRRFEVILPMYNSVRRMLMGSYD